MKLGNSIASSIVIIGIVVIAVAASESPKLGGYLGGGLAALVAIYILWPTRKEDKK